MSRQDRRGESKKGYLPYCALGKELGQWVNAVAVPVGLGRVSSLQLFIRVKD